MIYEITQEIEQIAKNWSSFTGNKYSIMHDGKNRFAGNLAEVVFSMLYPKAIRISNIDYQADFIYKKKRIDVKCKQRTVYCKDEYTVTVNANQVDFNVDLYFFYSYVKRDNCLEFLGWISKNEFFEKCFLLKKGAQEGYNGYVARGDCYNVRISQLRKLSSN